MNKRLKAFKYQLRINKEQQKELNFQIDCVRYVYNLALQTKNDSYKSNANLSLSAYDLHKQLPLLRESNEWIRNCPNAYLQQAIIDMCASYTNFFKGRAKFPKYKSKRNQKNTVRFFYPKIDFTNWTIKVPKIKTPIKIFKNENWKFDGKQKQATISRTATGKYFISILVELEVEDIKQKEIKESTTIGIDLGITHFLIDNNGNKVDNPRFLQNTLKQLRIEQRKMQRKFKKGVKAQSKGYEKQKLIVAKLHEKVTNKRKNFLHNVSSQLVDNNDSICIENLNVKGMIQNKKLSQKIADVAWGEFTRQLNYKAVWQGKNILEIGRFEPSSKTCSNCNHKVDKLPLQIREWTCPECNTLHDRDTNAAQNVKNFGLFSAKV